MQYDLSKIDKPLGQLPMTVQWDLVEYAHNGGKIQGGQGDGEWFPIYFHSQWNPSFIYRADPEHYTPTNKETENMKIEKGIPIPAEFGPGRPRKYPFPDMEVGDCLVCSIEEGRKCRDAAYNFGQKYGLKFMARTVGNAIHIWRVK